MSQDAVLKPDKPAAVQAPEIRDLSVGDIVEALFQGLRDFRTSPLYGLFFGALYAAAGLGVVLLLQVFDLPYFAYPLAMGFTLIAPFVVVALYEVSRRLERGEPLSWGGVLGAIGAASKRDLRWMALVTSFTLVIWMDIAALLYFGVYGMSATSFREFFTDLFTTPQGWIFLLVGNLVGAIIAAAVFSFSAISYPLLYDRDIDFVTAMVTSVKTVLRNPGPMAVWAVIIGLMIALSFLSAFLGLVVTLPVLGHATWHVYRRAVAPAKPASSS